MIEALLLATVMPVYQSGATLMAICKAPSRLPECVSYIVGVNDAISFRTKDGDRKPYCLPDHTPRIVLVDKVVDYYASLSGLSDVPASAVIEAAFATAYPCEN